MSTLTFKTARGADIKINCEDLYVNGSQFYGGWEVAEDATNGTCIKPFFANALIPIPAEMIDAVNDLKAEIKAAARAAVAEQVAYDRHVNKIYTAMDAGEDRADGGSDCDCDPEPIDTTGD